MIAFDPASPDGDLTGFYCTRCGVGGWHPEAAQCAEQNCGLSAGTSFPLAGAGASGAGADLPSLGSAPVFPADVDSLFHSEGVTR